MRCALAASVAVLVGCGYGVAPISNAPGVATGTLRSRGTDDLDDARVKYKIYVVSLFSKGETFTPRGKQTLPTFDVGLASAVAVDKHGKIYVTVEDPNGKGFLSTFSPDGTPTTPNIDNLYRPTGVAVDGSGKIYVVTDGNVNTYTPAGKPTTPTIPGVADQVVVDENGKIYVGGRQSGVRTYKPDGSPTKPTIPVAAHAIAVDKNGKIYVAGYTDVITYTPHGKPTTPTITGLYNPVGLAVDPNGKIFVVNFGSYLSGPFSVTSYKANGEQTSPTITGLTDPVGVAIN